MRFAYHQNSTTCCVHEHIPHRDLCPGVEVKLGLFKVDQLALSGSEKANQDRQGLGDPKPHVREAYQVVGSAVLGVRQASNPHTHLSVILSRGRHLPGEAKASELLV